jgi:hypothetical protein
MGGERRSDLSEEKKQPFWAKCGACGHLWTICFLPMEMTKAATIMMRACCPMCGAGSETIGIARQSKGVLLEETEAPGGGV